MNRSQGYLPFWKAIWNSFWNVDIGYFPRVIGDGKPTSLASESILKEISDAIPAEFPTSSIDGKPLSDSKLDGKFELALKLARESLDEVKKLTEYQDQKATRSLTISTFLTALSGAIFLKVSELYPLPSIEELSTSTMACVLLYAVYLTFSLFVLCSASGALVVFHATRTGFKFPSPDPENPERELNRPKSQIFFPGMIAVRPSAWAGSYVDMSSGSAKAALRDDIAVAYFRNYVAESYLVAAKVADKVRYLEPAHDILSFGLRCLLVWLLLTAAVFVIKPLETAATNTPGKTTISSATSADDGSAASGAVGEAANEVPTESDGSLP